MKLSAITKVLSQYKVTETGVITKAMISDAWAELLEAEDKLKEVSELANINLGKVAFDAYRKKRGGKNHDGSPTPEWEEVGRDVQEGWETAAQAVMDHLQTS